jgi:8-oxo-dGTP pyrophosphatase MutT (NUDIX family)
MVARTWRGGLEQDENVLQAIVRKIQEETGITVAPKRVAMIEDLLTSRYKLRPGRWKSCSSGRQGF